MCSYDAKRFISILLMVFGGASVIMAAFVMFGLLIMSIPTTLVLGVILLQFGYQLNQEAQLDNINVPPK